MKLVNVLLSNIVIFYPYFTHSAQFGFSMGSNSDLVAGERLSTNLNIFRTILRLMNFSYIFLYFNMAMVISSNKYGYHPSVCLSHVVAQVC